VLHAKTQARETEPFGKWGGDKEKIQCVLGTQQSGVDRRGTGQDEKKLWKSSGDKARVQLKKRSRGKG